MTRLIDTVAESPQLSRPRHPEKAHRPDQPVARKPDWIRVKAPGSPVYAETRAIVRAHQLATVCEEAGCPNIGECWDKKPRDLHDHGRHLHPRLRLLQRRDRPAGAARSATSRRASPTRWPSWPAHVVITSVDRDDLADGGAAHFARSSGRSARRRPADDDRGADAGFPAQGRRARGRGRGEARRVQPQSRDRAVANISRVRPGARYFHSLRLLQRVKELDPAIFTKSGMMVGLGEERNEVLQMMDDMRSADIDFLTIGQYLQPTAKHHPVMRFVPPDEFDEYATIGAAKGFLIVSSSPLTRSSHHAGEDFARLRAARAASLHKRGSGSGEARAIVANPPLTALVFLALVLRGFGLRTSRGISLSRPRGFGALQLTPGT